MHRSQALRPPPPFATLLRALTASSYHVPVGHLQDFKGRPRAGMRCLTQRMLTNPHSNTLHRGVGTSERLGWCVHDSRPPHASVTLDSSSPYTASARPPRDRAGRGHATGDPPPVPCPVSLGSNAHIALARRDDVQYNRPTPAPAHG